MIVVWGLLGLCVIVVVHEFGHFIAAKLLDIDVESFSIGMGPVLARKKIGKTEFRLSLIPLGGYCGIKGETDLQKALEADLPQIEAEPHSFFENPIKRLIIALSGPIANVIFTVFAFIIISFVGQTSYTTKPIVILAPEIYPEMTSSAQEAGIKTGDYITAIGKEKINTFSDIISVVSTHPDETLDFEIIRNNETLTIPVFIKMDKASARGLIGVVNWISPEIENIAPDSAAEKAGLKSGDIIIESNGIEVLHTAGLVKTFENAEKAVLKIKRNNETVQIELPLEKTQDGSFNLGIEFKSLKVTEKASSFFGGIADGFAKTGELIALTLKTITWFFKGIDVSQAVSGPIRITVMLGEVAESGFAAGIKEGITTVLYFLSLISVSLFIMNLLPIPILDGGIVLFALIEIIRGKGVAPKTMQRFQIVGLCFIAFLFIIAFTGDINYIIERFKLFLQNKS